MTKTEQDDKIANICIEIRDICGRINERKREVNADNLKTLEEVLLKLRAINNGMRW